MPLTGAERQKRHREKQKLQHGAGHMRQLDAQRKKHARLANLEKARNAECIRQRRCRNNRQQNFNLGHNSDAEFAYKSPSAIGKAVKRVISAMPNSPRKRAAVMTRLSIKPFHQGPSTSGSHHNKLDTATEKAVTDFYEQSDISWTAPGRKDYVIIRTGKEKTRMQKKFLMMTVNEAHSLFCDANPGVKIGKSKFADLRPTHVCLNATFPHNMCLCKYHENMRLLLESLRSYIHGLPTGFHDFLETIVCNQDAEECMIGRCELCHNKFEDVYHVDDEVNVSNLTWYQ